jgi:cytochrome c-type biogenesis protein CcmH/NrfG
LGYGKEALEILSYLDRANDRIIQAHNQGLAIPSEEAQFSTIIENFRDQAGAFLHEIGGLRGLEERRQHANPPETNWWWWPERIVSQKRTVSVKGYLRTGGIILGVLIVLVIVYQFIKPDAQTIAVQQAIQSAQVIGSEGDLQKALPEVEQGLQAAPEDPELLILKGCLLNLIPGRESEAQAVFDQAEKIVADHEMFLLQRAQTYFVFNKFDIAQTDAQQAVDLNPKSAKGYLVLGQILESQREMDKAYAAYEKASSLASENDDSVIAAQARIKMGMVMQLMGVNMFEPTGITPTPTP